MQTSIVPWYPPLVWYTGGKSVSTRCSLCHEEVGCEEKPHEKRKHKIETGQSCKMLLLRGQMLKIVNETFIATSAQESNLTIGVAKREKIKMGLPAHGMELRIMHPGATLKMGLHGYWWCVWS